MRTIDTKPTFNVKLTGGTFAPSNDRRERG